ncbi:ABC transporter ATP-binding protein [Ammoniphilus resinae]|uniref:Energy-coupling factor transport system ATP-binding protein n=1 Tax=Ammoniphilus resinae TaxID=861532 RepID=A0ABS4GQK2_9BACL|nr:ABC transporter ATP-binding protein [Ammoniphilus resinae]MBP1932539.1 energy-coupling factor transport system ATP-binding protein [Ammoniphilus resinae]
MAILECKQLYFSYPEEPKETLSELSLSIQEGEFLVLAGPSGCGKSTLLQLLKKEIHPFGSLTGDIFYQGKALEDYPPAQLTKDIGLVFQDPENQIVMDEVLQELVLGLENMGVGVAEMRRRVAELVHFFGLEPLLHAKTETLSGGQKQLLNLASVLLLRPQVLLLDEPTAQLDPIAAKELIQIVYRLNQEFGLTIVLVEHRLEEVFPLADRVILMKQGRIHCEGSPREVIDQVWESGNPELITYLPSIARLYLELDPSKEQIPLTVKECKAWAEKTLKPMSPNQGTNEQYPEVLLEIKEAFYQYSRQTPWILEDLSLQIYKGDHLAILGGNGAGKSTLLKLLAGLLSPQKGKVLFGKQNIKKLKKSELYQKIGYLPQDPMLFFVRETVEQELIASAEQSGQADPKKAVHEITSQLGLSNVLNRHPHDCSGGERQKAALACLLLNQPEVLLLDEPTKGLDPVSKQQLAFLLQELHAQGITLVIVSHDVEFAAQYASRCALLFDGGIASHGTPQDMFAGNVFYTTAVSRAVRNVLPTMITCEEVLAHCRAVRSIS